MDSILDLFLTHYESILHRDSLGFAEPIPIDLLSKSGMSDKDIVVYLRFIDLLRSTAMVSRFCYIGGIKQNRSLIQENMKKALWKVAQDYQAFICNICQVGEPSPFFAFRILLTTGDYTNGGLIPDHADMRCLPLSFDDFRALVEIDTALMLQGENLGPDVSGDEGDKREAEALSTQDLNIAIDRMKERLFELELRECEDIEIPMPITYFDAIKEAKTLYEAGNVSGYIRSLKEKMTVFQAERESRRVSITTKPIKKQKKKKAPIIRKATKPQPIIKCTMCDDPAFREGYCWYHYQWEHYTSR